MSKQETKVLASEEFWFLFAVKVVNRLCGEQKRLNVDVEIQSVLESVT